jgi:hypothetical protein
VDDGVAIDILDAGHDALNPSTRLSQEPCLGVKVNWKRPGTWAASQVRVSLEMCAE